MNKTNIKIPEKGDKILIKFKDKDGKDLTAKFEFIKRNIELIDRKTKKKYIKRGWDCHNLLGDKEEVLIPYKVLKDPINKIIILKGRDKRR